MNKITEIYISSAAWVAHKAAHGSTSEHSAYHSAGAIHQHHAQVQHLPFHFSQHQSSKHIISSPSIDVNHLSHPGKVLFSELQSKGWKAGKLEAPTCALDKKLRSQWVQTLASKAGDVAEGFVANGENVRAIPRVVKVFGAVLKYPKATFRSITPQVSVSNRMQWLNTKCSSRPLIYYSEDVMWCGGWVGHSRADSDVIVTS